MSDIQPCPFNDLPLHRPGPPYNAWNAWGEAASGFGRLNLITPDSIRRGRDEIREGITINLNMPLGMTPIHPKREELQHEISQAVLSTQWDGFRHYPYQDYPEKGEYTYHGGLSTEEAKDVEEMRFGTQNYIKKPITSRAHLLDIPSYLSNHNLPPLDPFTTQTPISASTLQSCATESGVHFQPGDILVVRTGWTEAFQSLDEEGRKVLMKREKRESVGVAQGQEVLRWHWDNMIAAVASDGVAYESMPAAISPSLHEVFLAGWGMPIGELLDLRELAAECKRLIGGLSSLPAWF